MWASNRNTVCSASSPSEACSLNGVVSVLAGAFFAVETLAPATLTALVLYRNGKRFERRHRSHRSVLAFLAGRAHAELLT